MGSVQYSLYTGIISSNIVNIFIFVMVKCGVLFEVRTDLLDLDRLLLQTVNIIVSKKYSFLCSRHTFRTYTTVIFSCTKEWSEAVDETRQVDCRS
jgi:hypothetical protein